MSTSRRSTTLNATISRACRRLFARAHSRAPSRQPQRGKSRRPQQLRRRTNLETLESRQLFSIGGVQPTMVQVNPYTNQPIADVAALQISASSTNATAMAGSSDVQVRNAANSDRLTPQAIQSYYGISNLVFNHDVALDGSGQTIAIIDWNDDPNIANDLHQFDAEFNLSDPQFEKFWERDSNGNPPAPADGQNGRPDGSEITLDVEWAHAMAPGANIMLVEAQSSSYDHLMPIVNWVRQQPGVSVVSMSWGAVEDQMSASFGSSESQYDPTFTTPSGHEGVTFIASTGDRDPHHNYTTSDGTGEYPALSPNVVGVGATVLTSDGQGGFLGEGSDPMSGGGGSEYESPPSYQLDAGLNWTSGGRPTRVSPDVAWADATSDSKGLPIYDSYDSPSSPSTLVAWGTSASAPEFAGLVAIANQGRTLAGEDTLDGPGQTLPLMYQLPNTFHDITQTAQVGHDSEPKYQPGPGYDLTTGLGSPVGGLLVAELVAGHALSMPSAPTTPPSDPTTPPSSPTTPPSSPTTPRGSETPNEVYVTDIFEAVLGRDPTSGELSSWANQLDGGLARDSFVNTIDHSDEYYANFIRPAYEKYLGREADAGGIAYWTSQMRAGLTDEQLEAKFIASDEFFQNAGGTDSGWVESLYEHLLGRGADAQGEAYWLTQLAAGEQRFDVALGFTCSLERESQRIQADYWHYLGRAADQQGLNYWTTQFSQGQTNEDLITGFLASDEYYQSHSA